MLTPDEAAELGMSPGPSFAEAIKQAMSTAPDVIILGTIKDCE